MESFNSFQFIHQLVALGPRLGENEQKSAEVIINVLREHDIPHTAEEFINQIPRTVHAHLEADGQNIPCLGCSFVSGEITADSQIVAGSFEVPPAESASSVILYSPQAKDISLFEFFRIPAVAVAAEAVEKLQHAKKIHGTVEVEKYSYRSANILAGNRKNPRTIVFTHYDSFFGGGLDNASGVATTIHVLLNNPVLLNDHLFVIAGAEELSYDQPVYWGAGYRHFEAAHFDLLENAAQLIVVDGVGIDHPLVDTSNIMLEQTLPLAAIDRWKAKTKDVGCDFAKVLSTYHTALDDGSQLHPEYLDEAALLLESLLR